MNNIKIVDRLPKVLRVDSFGETFHIIGLDEFGNGWGLGMSFANKARAISVAEAFAKMIGAKVEVRHEN
jgi:hypothetical protein